MKEELENHMVVGNPEPKEPQPTEIECHSCGQVVEGTEFRAFRNSLTDETVIICCDCWHSAQIQTAELPIKEREEE